MARRNPEARKAYLRAYHHTHKAVKNARRRARYHARREEELANRRAHRQAHLEEMRAKDNAYNATHREAAKSRSRRWRQDNPERVQHNHRVGKQRRRARLQATTSSDLTAAQWREIKEAYGHRCVYCGRKMQRLTLDHITPVIHGGALTVTNVVPACGRCNSKKRDRNVLRPIQPLLLTLAPPRNSTG